MRWILILVVCFGAAVQSHSFGQTYDAYADFSGTQNPNGVWSYGWSTDLDGPLTVYPDTFIKEGGTNWTDNTIEELGDPNVAYVPANDTTADVPAGTMAFHPGPGNQFSHCRSTAPSAGVYNIQATFTSLSYGGPHVYVLHNGVSIGDSLLNQGVPWAPSFNSVALAAGDTVDAVVGVGIDGVYFNDEVVFDLTLTPAVTGTAPFAPGVYTALLTGSSGPGGVSGYFTAHVRKTGEFTASLNFEGQRVTLKGRFSGSNPYTTVVQLKNGQQLTVTLDFDSNGNLTGTVSDGSATFALLAGEPSNTVSADGLYPFTISASSGTGDVPEGTGFGYMSVRAGGAVSIVGELGDGASFSTSSAIISGSLVPVYANPYKSAAGGIAGTLVFQDVPDVSDCSGTLSWARPAKTGSSAYAQGFTASADFLADQFDPSITGLAGNDASFVASGADLQTSFSTSVTLRSTRGMLSTFDGNTVSVRLSLLPAGDVFYGSFEDPVTHKVHDFTGVLLPKSRAGAGLFFSNGVSGSVDIGY